MRRRARARKLSRAGWALLLAVLAAACGRGPTATAPLPPPSAPPLLTREALFGEAARENAQVSPRGDLLAFVSPRNGAPNLFVVPAASLGIARPVTNLSGQGVAEYRWAADGANLLYVQRSGADESARLYSANAGGGAVRALTTEGAHAEIVGVGASDPTGAIVALTEAGQSFPDLYRIDVSSGSRTLIERNTHGFHRFWLDRENRVRLACKATADGAMEIWVKSTAARAQWRKLFTIPFEDALATTPLAIEGEGASFLMLDSIERGRAALARVDMETGAKTELGESPRADIVDVWLDPATRAPEAFAAEYLRREWRAMNPEAQADLTYLDERLVGELRVVSRSLDDKVWIVEEDGPITPPRSWLYRRGDPQNRTLTLLFRHRPALERAPLQPMVTVEIESRDGVTLVSYLTLPIGSDANGDSRPDYPIPIVLAPHDGPWARNSYGFDPLHQWLANRGYGALSVNFRGSSGLGRALLNQGTGEWGAKMQDDLLDSVQWAVEEGIAQPERIAIIGSGYGGYAAQHALAFTPERFACGVSLSGPASLEPYLAAAPARAEWQRASLYRRVADPRTEEGRALLRDRSPATRAGGIVRPLLLAQGGADPFAAGSDRLAQSARARRAGLVYLLYPEEGRSFARAARLSFYAAADQFLAGCLGGRAEPLGRALDGAPLQAIAGADRVEGLSRFAFRAPEAASAPVASDAAVATPDAAAAPAEEAKE